MKAYLLLQVTQKSPGLNPNATEFLSKQDVHHWDDINTDGKLTFSDLKSPKLMTPIIKIGFFLKL